MFALEINVYAHDFYKADRTITLTETTHRRQQLKTKKKIISLRDREHCKGRESTVRGATPKEKEVVGGRRGRTKAIRREEKELCGRVTCI
jgi:hypothetical protein